MAKGLIFAQSNAFKRMYLPSNYQQTMLFEKEHNSLLGTILKGKKNNFANFLCTRLAGANQPIPPQKLLEITGSIYKAMDSRFEQTPVANILTNSRINVQQEARLAYIRMMINLNRLHQIANPGQTAFPSFWDDINADLETCRTKNTQCSIKCLDTLSSKRIADSGMAKKLLTTAPTLMFNSQLTRRFTQGLHRR
ncbi:hypothetical protein Pst134EA_009431 [Puccinia striiformis f. sp. tritici]|uniref:hypothetical protein n=1 Tax=Puccinia striiformis f. sp. tritici TaxID=168172 RepID=UPI00200736E6|nr:hypothetical protein Pst134EA_009431 [Puccinia striiformis f. sp. tritici]KAH9468902.1 hypothetical protein Pst134EA_009431 [Puccinia striiformis f. sp. tritici]